LWKEWKRTKEVVEVKVWMCIVVVVVVVVVVDSHPTDESDALVLHAHVVQTVKNILEKNREREREKMNVNETKDLSMEDKGKLGSSTVPPFNIFTTESRPVVGSKM
jgi:hypothetical protein